MEDTASLQFLPYQTSNAWTGGGSRHTNGRPTEVSSRTCDTSKVQLHQNKHCSIMKLWKSHAKIKPNAEVQEALKSYFEVQGNTKCWKASTKSSSLLPSTKATVIRVQSQNKMKWTKQEREEGILSNNHGKAVAAERIRQTDETISTDQIATYWFYPPEL